MAKISELSDEQLRKAFSKYQAQFKEKQTDKLRSILKQIRSEQQKRGGSAKKSSSAAKPSRSAAKSSSSSGRKKSSLADLAAAADQSVRKTKTKKKSGKLSQRKGEIKKPQISPLMGNLMLGSGLVLGILSMFMLFEYFFFDAFGTSGTMMFVYLFLMAVGIGLGKASMMLTDDNR